MKAWGFSKNVKTEDAQVFLSQQELKGHKGRITAVALNGRVVGRSRIRRWQKRCDDLQMTTKSSPPCPKGLSLHLWSAAKISDDGFSGLCES